MTLYIDPAVWPGHGRLWSHLASDTSYAELHAFAAGIGLPRRAFDGDHYDVVADRYDDALAAGARLTTSRELVILLTATGLRRRKISRLARPAAEQIEPIERPDPGYGRDALLADIEGIDSPWLN